MDLGTWIMIAVIGWTVILLILVAAMSSRAPWKAVIAWLGLALLPLGLWLVGLTQPAIDGWNTLVGWWNSLRFTVMELVGLSVLGLAVALLLISRLVPSRPRRTRSRDTTPAVAPASTPPTYRQPQPSESERTLILPDDQRRP